MIILKPLDLFLIVFWHLGLCESQKWFWCADSRLLKGILTWIELSWTLWLLDKHQREELLDARNLRSWTSVAACCSASFPPHPPPPKVIAKLICAWAKMWRGRGKQVLEWQISRKSINRQADWLWQIHREGLDREMKSEFLGEEMTGRAEERRFWLSNSSRITRVSEAHSTAVRQEMPHFSRFSEDSDEASWLSE